MTLKELINLRKKKDSCMAMDKFWKGYSKGWEDAYRDIEEILEQRGFDMNTVVMEEANEQR